MKIGMTHQEYIRSKAEGPYKELQEAHDRINGRYENQKREEELVERVANKVMFKVDTSKAVGKVKELEDMINNLGGK